MAFSLRGQYHRGCVAAAAVVGLLGLLVAVVFAAQVCLNKVLPPLHPVDLSFPSPPPLPLRPRDLLVLDFTSPPLPSATPSTRQPLLLQILTHSGHFVTGCWRHDFASPRDPTASFIFYLQRRQATYSSVFWNMLHQLGRPIYNCLEQSFRPAVSASGAPTAHRRRSRHSYLIRCVCAYPVLGPVCNFVFFGGLACNLAA
jgi:hypothetical protein